MNFIDKLAKRNEVLRKNPEAFPSSNIKKRLHKYVITRQTTVYYTYDKSKIYILTVYDNRQDPEKLKIDIK